MWWIALTLPCALAQEVPPPAPDAPPLPIPGPSDNPLEPPSPLDGPVEVAPTRLPPPAPTPPNAARALPDWRVGYEWVSSGPATVDAVSAVAIGPDGTSTWALAALDGAVWITENAGRDWQRVLEPIVSGSRDEEILREIEARISELGTGVDTSGFVSEDDLQTMTEETQQATQQVLEEVQSELDAGPWFLEYQAAVGGSNDAARPRVWFTTDGRLVVGRADGLRVAERTAQGWRPRAAWADPVTAFAELPDHTFLVGLTDGLVRGTRDLRDFEPLSPLEGMRITDLLLDGGLYASTTQGVWWTAEGITWKPLPATSATVYAAMPARRSPEPTAPALDLPLVLGTAATIVRAASPATDAAAAVRGGPMPDTVALARRGDGLLLAASSLGPWSSVDGGLSWESLSLGEEGVRELRDVDVAGDVLLVAAGGGLWQLQPKTELQPIQLPEWVSLGALVDSALTRKELTAHVGSRWAAALAPDVTLDGTYQQLVQDSWDADSWTIRNVDSMWSVGVILTWRPGRQQTSSSFDVLDPTSDLSVLVLDGDVIIDDGTSGAILASAVRRGATQYRDELAEKVGQLWRERQRLVAEGIRPTATLPDRVRLVLQIQEIEARLDALSDGAVSSWDPGEPSTTGRQDRRGGG